MIQYVATIGLDPEEYSEIQKNCKYSIIGYEYFPKILLKNGQLWIEAKNYLGMVPIEKVIFHGIFEDDFDGITALALWGGPCFPNPKAMMECRLKLPCLFRALGYSRFASPKRDYVSAQTNYVGEGTMMYVAKWGNWHCGENKTTFVCSWKSTESSIIEPFMEGKSVRIVVIGNQAWQIRLEGKDWKKSIHDPNAALMEIDPDLLEDTKHIQRSFGLEMIANDYIVSKDGKHLLEVNHIPNVTRFPEIWKAYCKYVLEWMHQ